MNHKLLLVEDDLDLGNVMKQYLEINEFDITLCRDGEAGLERFQNQAFDLCILDVMLPEMDGFTLAKHIRKVQGDMPFIFLTAKNQKDDRLKGLKLGADDYITKPFEIDELVLRIQNILRRTGKSLPEQVKLGIYTFNADNLTLSSATQTHKLTQQEAKLLSYFISNQNNIVKRTDILTELWGEDDYFAGRSMDVFISRLRKYLKEDSRIKIENIRGIGFRMVIAEV